jgi:hypothetical protein
MSATVNRKRKCASLLCDMLSRVSQHGCEQMAVVTTACISRLGTTNESNVSILCVACMALW